MPELGYIDVIIIDEMGSGLWRNKRSGMSPEFVRRPNASRSGYRREASQSDLNHHHLNSEPTMSRNTAWSKHNSSLPSDRIKPSTKGVPNVAKPKGKAKQQQPDDPPKSTQVRRLEALLAGVTSAPGTVRDPAGGCFCLGACASPALITGPG